MRENYVSANHGYAESLRFFMFKWSSFVDTDMAWKCRSVLIKNVQQFHVYKGWNWVLLC